MKTRYFLSLIYISIWSIEFIVSNLFKKFCFLNSINCVFDKWFDDPLDTNIFFSLTKTETDKTYIDNSSLEYLVLYEDNESIYLVGEAGHLGVNVLVINKINMNTTLSRTMDDLVTVIKGECEK